MANALLTYPGARAAGPVVHLDENALGFYEPNDVPNECIPLLRALLGESCHVGVLAEACAASAREAEKPRTRERGTKAEEQKTTKEHRLAGQPVYLAVVNRKVHKFSFSFRDSRSGIISEDQPIHWTNVKSKAQGYLMAMQRYDYF